MGVEHTLSHRFSAPLEQVGGALERAIAGAEAWTLGAVERERGEIDATLKAGLGLTADAVRMDLSASAEGGTLVEVRLTLGGLSRRGPREAAVRELFAEVGRRVARA